MTSKSSKTSSPEDLACRFCGAAYKTRRGIERHSCQRSKLAAEVGDASLVRAFYLFEFWFRYNGFSKRKQKGYQEFCRSPYFRLFSELESKGLPSTKEYIRWLSDGRVPSNRWLLNATMEQFRVESERSGDAREKAMRSLEKMASWCDQAGIDVADFFSAIGPGEAVLWLQTGKLSPWVLIATSKLDDLVGRMSEEQATLLAREFDVDYWSMRAKLSADKYQEVRSLLEGMGL